MERKDGSVSGKEVGVSCKEGGSVLKSRMVVSKIQVSDVNRVWIG